MSTWARNPAWDRRYGQWDLYHAVLKLLQGKDRAYWFPKEVAEAMGCTFVEAYFALMLLEGSNLVVSRCDGRWCSTPTDPAPSARHETRKEGM